MADEFDKVCLTWRKALTSEQAARMALNAGDDATAEFLDSLANSGKGG